VATGVHGGTNGDSPVLESEVDGGSARRRWSYARGENRVRRQSALGEGRGSAALQLTGEDGWWSLDPGEAVAARPGVKARWGAAVSGYLQKEEEEGEGEQRRWPAWRRAMVARRLPARTKMGRGRLGPASIGRFIAHAEDDAATGGGQVGNIT
jgi:hypothetical protein